MNASLSQAAAAIQDNFRFEVSGMTSNSSLYPPKGTIPMKYASLTIAAMFAIASGPLFAGDVASPTAHKNHDRHAHGTPVATFTEFDANKDGRLSKAEMAKHPLAAHFGMVDANRDGSLSRDEFAALQGM